MTEAAKAQKLDLPKQPLEALFLATTVNADARTIDVQFYSGTPVSRYSWQTGKSYTLICKVTPEACDLSRFNKGANVINSHNTYDLSSILGVIEKAWLKDGKGYATLRFSTRPDVEPFWQDIKDGIIQNVSMGIVVLEYEISVDKDGYETWTATKWQPFELSFLSVPADPDASTRLSKEPLYPCLLHRVQLTDQPPTKEETMDPKTTSTAPGGKEALANDAGATTTQPAAQPVQQEQQLQNSDPVVLERQRVQEILKSCRAVKLEQKVADDLIDKGVSLEAARKRILDLAAEKSDANQVLANQTGAGEAPKVDPTLPLDQRCKAEWDSNEKLRSEFGSLSTYQAFKQAESEGRARIFNQKSA